LGGSGRSGVLPTDRRMSLRRLWDAQSDNWIRWARAPGHDTYWRFHRDRFFELVPEPGRLTLDLGAGEGRVARDLRARGHRVVEIEGSHAMAVASAVLSGETPCVADLARLPLAGACADLAIAFMSLQDVDDHRIALREIGTVVTPGGRLVMAIVHPINSAGRFEMASGGDPPFVIRDSYFDTRRRADDIEHAGLAMRFEGEHRSLEAYGRALEDAGFVIEALREVGEPDPTNKWSRLPLFLDIRAVRR